MEVAAIRPDSCPPRSVPSSTFIRDVDNQLLVSGGMTYFIPGSAAQLSIFGNGDFHLFLTGGKQIFGRGHWLSGSGFRLPEDRNWGTQMWYWSNQWDYELPGHIYPLIGLNWFHWMDSAGIGSRIPVHGAGPDQRAVQWCRRQQRRNECHWC